MKTALQKIVDAQAEIEFAEAKLCAAVNEAYPAGAEIEWAHGRHIRYGVVVYTSNYGRGDRLRVRNVVTSKSYWINLYDVECAAHIRAKHSSQKRGTHEHS